jgi:hypothetical protein
MHNPPAKTPLELLLATAPAGLLEEALPQVIRRLGLEKPNGREKLVLLLTLMINPHEKILAQEEAILRGIDSDTLRKLKSSGEFPRQINS